MRTTHVRSYSRIWRGRLQRIGEHLRAVTEARAEPVRVVRDTATLDLFGSDEDVIRWIGRQPAGGEISGRLLEAARLQWK